MCLGKYTWGFAGPLVLKTQTILFCRRQNESRASHLNTAACANFKGNLEGKVKFSRTEVWFEKDFW